MALIKCNECGKEVSDQAETCPSCGYPIAKQVQKQLDMEKYSKITLDTNEKSGKKIAQKLYYVLLLNNIPCNPFPVLRDMQISSPTIREDVSLYKKWIKENLEVLKKVTIDNIKSISNNDAEALHDYNEYKKFIEHYEIINKRREEDKREIEEEMEQLELKHKRDLEEIDKKYSAPLEQTATSNIPKCPHCGSQRIENIGTLNRAISIGLLGLASSKIGKTKQCKSCGYKW